MRENKFRYTVIKGSGHVMVETFPLGDIENGRVVTWLKVNHASDDTCEIHVDQFTGLTDKNGKEIYKGDVLKYCEFRYITMKVGGGTSRVFFNNGGFQCSRNNSMGNVLFDLRIMVTNGRAEIIGNIHEHSDLLKGEQQ